MKERKKINRGRRHTKEMVKIKKKVAVPRVVKDGDDILDYGMTMMGESGGGKEQDKTEVQ